LVLFHPPTYTNEIWDFVYNLFLLDYIIPKNPNGELKIYDVCGNICETGDCFAEQRELHEIREGDKLIIIHAVEIII